MTLKESTVEKLLDSPRDKMTGNHRVATRGIGEVYRSLYYFATEICRVWDDTKTFWINDSYSTQSTKGACTQYRKVLTNRGYTEVQHNTTRRKKP